MDRPRFFLFFILFLFFENHNVGISVTFHRVDQNVAKGNSINGYCVHSGFYWLHYIFSNISFSLQWLGTQLMLSHAYLSSSQVCCFNTLLG